MEQMDGCEHIHIDFKNVDFNKNNEITIAVDKETSKAYVLNFKVVCMCCGASMEFSKIDLDWTEKAGEFFKILHTNENCNTKIYKRNKMTREL